MIKVAMAAAAGLVLALTPMEASAHGKKHKHHNGELIVGTGVGAVAGALIGGPLGALIGGAAGISVVKIHDEYHHRHK